MAVRLLDYAAPRLRAPRIWTYRRTLCVPNADDHDGAAVRERIHADLAACGARTVYDSWGGIAVRWLYRPDELPEDCASRSHDHIVVRALVERGGRDG